MPIPVIRGIIKRRLLVNFQADPEIVQRILPEPFRQIYSLTTRRPSSSSTPSRPPDLLRLGGTRSAHGISATG